MRNLLALLALLVVLVVAGQAHADQTPGLCQGVITVPANQVVVNNVFPNPDCMGDLAIVATVQEGTRGRTVWVNAVRQYPDLGRIVIRLNTADHDFPVRVAYYAFKGK